MHTQRMTIGLIAALLLCVPPVFGQADAELVMDDEHPRVGEEVVYRLTLELPEDAELDIRETPVFPKEFRLRKDDVTVRRTRTENGNEWVASFPLAVVRSGRIRIPELQFTVTTNDGTQHSVTGGEIVIHTRSWFPNENAPEPAEATSTVPLYQTNWFLIWALVILGVVIVAVTVTLWLSRRWKAHRPAPVAPPRPAHIVALESLDELASQNLPESERFEEFYTRLSEVLRQYLGHRYLFDSLDQTTTELTRHLEQLALPHAQFQVISEMLMDYDLVKFARFTPSLQKAREDFERTRTFVVTTTQDPNQEVSQ